MEKITGITDEELDFLIKGEWADDGSDSPGWFRNAESPIGEVMGQSMYPLLTSPGWRVCSGAIKETATDFDAALKWCDDRIPPYKLRPARRAATKQEERFAAEG